MKYRVRLQTGASLTVTVEAEDPEQAIEVAFNDHSQYLCMQCSGWGEKWSLELGEWDVLNLDGSEPDIDEIAEVAEG